MTSENSTRPLRWLTRERIVMGCIGYAAFYVFSISLLKFVNVGNSIAIFGSFWAAGRAAGEGLNPYLLYPLVWSPPDLGLHIREVNLNAPAALPLFQLFSAFPVVFGSGLWALISGTAYIACILKIARMEQLSVFQFALFLVSPVALSGLVIGQIYHLMISLAAIAWICFRTNRATLGCIALGVFIAIKPNFGLWCAAMLLAGYWRPAIITGAVAATLTLLPAVLYGPQVYHQWFAAAQIDIHGLVFPNDVSLHGYFQRLGLPAVAKFLPAIVGAAGLLFVWRRKPNWPEVHAVGILLGILCSPLAWIDYVFFLLPSLTYRPWGPEMKLATTISFVPISLVIFAVGKPFWLVLVGSLYFAAMLVMAWVVVSWTNSKRSGPKLPFGQSPAPDEAAAA